MSRNSNAVNINKLMHEYAKLFNGDLEPECYRVSPSAVMEYTGRVKDKKFDIQPKNISEFWELVRAKIIVNTPGLCKITRNHDRKTIYDVDIIEFFNRVGRDVV